MPEAGDAQQSGHRDEAEDPAPARTVERTGAADGTPQAPTNLEQYLEKGDVLQYPGYIPGYSKATPLGLGPLVPDTHPPVAGTPAYGAPTLTEEWTFAWSGYMTASLQFSLDERPITNDGQSELVVNIPPQTVDEWASFLSTQAVPGNWVGNNFVYGNKYVSATVSLDTWNPTNPTTFYQLGSQYFINKSFLRFTPDPVGGIRATWDVGYNNVIYGQLAKYGGGLYTNPITGTLQGVGEALGATMDVADGWSISAQHGIMNTRDGTPPFNLVRSEESRWNDPARASTWINHSHLGFTRRGDPELRVTLHHIYAWTADDRTAQAVDNPDTRAIDEQNPPDASLHQYSFDVLLESPTLGFLGIGGAYMDADQIWQLRGLMTYAGDGELMTQRWLGEDTGGTGTIMVGAINYMFTLEHLLSHPEPVPGDRANLIVNTGYHITHTTSDNAVFSDRTRHKYGADVTWQFSEYVGVSLRGDRVVPSSKDDQETFHVIMPRILFRTHWYAHEQISLRYVKWFYGDRTRTEATGERSIDRIDDELVALNFNMYW